MNERSVLEANWLSWASRALLIVLLGGLFYLLYPKYYFPAAFGGRVRCNRITGGTQILNRDTGRWQDKRPTTW